MDQLKARLVIFDNHLKKRTNYHGTFSLVAKMATVQAFLAIAATKK